MNSYVFVIDEDGLKTELCYWRMHRALHAFFEKLWRTSDAENTGAFNCETLNIDYDMIDGLEELVKKKSLYVPKGLMPLADTTPAQEKHNVEFDLEQCKIMREAMAKGMLLEYTAWY